MLHFLVLTILIKIDTIEKQIRKGRKGELIFIKKKLAILKDLLSMFIFQHRNHLSYLFGFSSALIFSIIYIKIGIDYALFALAAGILVFEVFNYFFGGSPDVIVMGVDSEEDIMKTLKKSLNKAVRDKKEENNE